MVHKWLCLSCGGLDLVDARCFQLLVSGQSFLPICCLTIQYSGSSQTAIFSPSVAFSAGRVHSLLVSSIPIILLSATSQASFGTISSDLHTRLADTLSFVEQPSLRHTCPKASWILVLSGCGKSLLHRGVGRQMRDCTPG